MDYEQLDPNLIDLDPHNLRVVTPESVDDLAGSILEHGLLQNLVVEPKGSRYVCRAGNRRLCAIKKLMAEGKWSGPVVCLVKRDSRWSQLVENVMRQDVQPWRLGARFLELKEAGYTKQQIGTKIGMTPQRVSMLQQIAEGLHPKAIAKFEQSLPNGTLTLSDLCRIARVFDPETFTPDAEGQIAEAQKLLGRVRRAAGGVRKPVTERVTVWRRYQKLRDNKVAVPAKYEAVVDAVVLYLSGENERLRFE